MSKSNIQLVRRVITGEPEICPSCGSAIPEGFMLEDGDTVPGNYGEKNDYQRRISGVCAVLVGRSSCCGNYLFYIEAQTIDSRIACEFAETLDWFQENSENMSDKVILPQSSYVARYHGSCPEVPKIWGVNVIATGRGCAFEHLIGPFALKDTSIIGEYGVAACGCGGSGDEDTWDFAERMLNDLWDDFCALTENFKYQPRNKQEEQP